MNRILTVPFLRGTLRISRTPAGDVHKVCVNDLCGAMRRSILLKNGTVLRRCPSLTYLDAEHPEELYADFTEAVELVKWMSSGAKLLRMRGREVLENLQHLRMAQDTTATDVSEGSAPRIIELEYVGNRFSVRLEDGRYMVNATEMARPFDKRPAYGSNSRRRRACVRHWSRTASRPIRSNRLSPRAVLTVPHGWRYISGRSSHNGSRRPLRHGAARSSCTCCAMAIPSCRRSRSRYRRYRTPLRSSARRICCCQRPQPTKRHSQSSMTSMIPYGARKSSYVATATNCGTTNSRSRTANGSLPR